MLNLSQCCDAGPDPNACGDPAKAAAMLEEFAGEQREHVLALFLDGRQVPIGTPYVVSIGTMTASLVHPREVFREAIRRSAASLILAHNHPSGNPSPSPDDLALTRRIRQAGELLGIALVDHIILATRGFVSLRERGEL